ncbi:MAG: ATP-binding cassette domain-containing protein [Alistipes sp.]|nr:ATP-binding cassette domain-containing protein [Alistipes sp.]
MIKAENIIKSFEGRTILNNISTEFGTGQTNLIIGRSGSGKTVLLKSLVGLHEVDSGAIYYDDICFSTLDFRTRKAIRKDVGMIFQGGALLDASTVVENVKLPLDLFTEQSEEEKLERVHYCLKRVNLEHAHHLYPSELSGGMVKRAAIARAIVMNPRYLFCDEPNSGLDPQTSIVIDNLIYDITKEYNITTIINTHDMNSVMEIGEKIVFIHEGNKWWEGTKDDIFHTENRELDDFVFASAMAKRAKIAR